MVHLYRKLIWLFLFPTALLHGQVTMELSRKSITTDETVDMILEMEGGGVPTAPSIPLPEGLKILATSRQESIFNGQRSYSVIYTLRPEKSGNFQIGPFNLEGGKGDQKKLPALNLTVTEPKVIQSTENLFITLESSSEELLVHQTVELALTIYSRVTVANINMLDFPEDDFDISKWQEVRAPAKQIGGNIYRVQRYVAQLTPTQAGTIHLDPRFRVEVLDHEDPIRMLTGSRSTRILRVQLKEPVKLTVTHPPEEGRPENYSGHLGTFRLNAQVSPREVRVGDPVTLRIELSGSGSFQHALPPGIKESDDFKVYQPKLITEDMGRDGLSGRKVIEQVVIPKHTDVTEVPELEFSYYDPVSKEYRTTTSGPFSVTVTGSGKTVGANTVTSLPPADRNAEPAVLGEDLIYLKTEPGDLHPAETLLPGWTFTTLSTLPFALWALSGLMVRYHWKQGQDQVKKRRQQAPRRLRRHLRELEDGEKDLHERIWSILTEYLAARLNLPPGELNPRDALPRVQAQISAETHAMLTEWMERCERARFAGGDTEINSRDTQESFREFILKLDRELGR